jgi:hypothetical protein
MTFNFDGMDVVGVRRRRRFLDRLLGIPELASNLEGLSNDGVTGRATVRVTEVLDRPNVLEAVNAAMDELLSATTSVVSQAPFTVDINNSLEAGVLGAEIGRITLLRVRDEDAVVSVSSQPGLLEVVGGGVTIAAGQLTGVLRADLLMGPAEASLVATLDGIQRPVSVPLLPAPQLLSVIGERVPRSQSNVKVAVVWLMQARTSETFVAVRAQGPATPKAPNVEILFGGARIPPGQRTGIVWANTEKPPGAVTITATLGFKDTTGTVIVE